jgi:hypothetical protein
LNATECSLCYQPKPEIVEESEEEEIVIEKQDLSEFEKLRKKQLKK